MKKLKRIKGDGKKIQGYWGQTEAIKQLGIDMSTECLEAYAKIEYREPPRKNKIISMIHKCLSTGVEIPQAWIDEYNGDIRCQQADELDEVIKLHVQNKRTNKGM